MHILMLDITSGLWKSQARVEISLGISYRCEIISSIGWWGIEGREERTKWKNVFKGNLWKNVFKFRL